MSRMQHVQSAVSELRNAITSGTQELHDLLKKRDVLSHEIQKIHNRGTSDPYREQQLRMIEMQTRHYQRDLQNLRMILSSLSSRAR